MAVKTTLRENITIALQSIKGNKLRASLTAVIIAIGIMALVGILTAIEGIKAAATNAFAGLGANSFTIQNRGADLSFGPGGNKKVYPPIRYDQAQRFKKTFDAPIAISINLVVSNTSIAKYNNKKTNPNVLVKGTNENHLKTGGYELAQGRNFSQAEVDHGDNVTIIGTDIKNKLFDSANPINKYIFLGADKFLVIGVVASKGSGSQFGGGDKFCLIPIFRAKQLVKSTNPTFEITATASSTEELNAGIDEATPLFRNIRGLHVTQPDNFEIVRSDSIQKELNEQMSVMTLGGFIISFITLIGAAIGLMNIMLVSVTERTREIGLRKSIGATPAIIRKQFLIEAIVICLMGGAGGIILGMAIGNLVALGISGQFIVPWGWLLVALAMCTVIGLLSGYYPAKKAAQLEPIEALRYE